MNNAYVYAICVEGVVRYIGKGSGRPMKRAKEHLRRARLLLREGTKGVKPRILYNHLASAMRRGVALELQVIAGQLTDDEAFDCERQEIANREGLWNLMEGGVGGRQPNEAVRQKMRDAASRRAATPEGRQNLMRASLSAKNGQSDEHKKRSREHLEKIRVDPDVQARRKATVKSILADDQRGAALRRGLQAGRVSGLMRASHSAESHCRQGQAMKAYWAKWREART